MKDALATTVGTADKPESLYSRRLLNQDLDAGYIRIEHAASDGSAGKVDDNVRAPMDDLSDEYSSREVDEPEHFPSMALDDLSDRDGYMADPASDVDSPRSADMAIDDMSDGDGPTSPRSSDDVVRPPKVRPNLLTCCSRSRAVTTTCLGGSRRPLAIRTRRGPTMPSTTRTARTRRCRCVANL